VQTYGPYKYTPAVHDDVLGECRHG